MSPTEVRISRDEVLAVTKAFAELLEQGCPIREALRQVAEGTRNKLFQVVLADIRENLVCGVSLAELFGRHPNVFDQVYIEMVRRGCNERTLDIAMKEFVAIRARVPEQTPGPQE